MIDLHFDVSVMEEPVCTATDAYVVTTATREYGLVMASHINPICLLQSVHSRIRTPYTLCSSTDLRIDEVW